MSCLLKKFLLVASILALSLDVALADIPYNMPVGITEISREVYSLHMYIFWICVGISVVVFGAMFYSIVRHRKSAGRKASQFSHSTKMEILWTLIPCLILIVIAIPSVKTLIKMENTGDAELTIKVTGYQWLWHYDYLGNDVNFYSKLSTSQSEIYNTKKKGKNYLLEVDHPMVIPVNKKVRFLFTSGDVLHAWWVPDLAVKKDAVPGFINESWTKAEKIGTYRGQCAELCGRGHAFMPIVVEVVSDEDFRKWMEKMGKSPYFTQNS